jgi:hypothetical protein
MVVDRPEFIVYMIEAKRLKEDDDGMVQRTDSLGAGPGWRYIVLIRRP